jgi:uncharacterized protein
MLKIVVDTNVIVSALLKPDSLPQLIINIVSQGLLTLCVSQEIFDEYQGVLARDKFKKLDRKKVGLFLDEMKKRAVWTVPRVSVNVTKQDPADNKFLECALAAKADYFITGNTLHFPFKKFRKTRVVSPREFISDIAEELFR